MPLDNEPIPLIIVEGFLGGGGVILWGAFESYLNQGCKSSSRQERRSIFAHVGPVSSLHDRACELYYNIRGGTVDYGAEHCREHNHARFGRNHEHGLYPQWSRKRPLHFLGHSMGGPTITKLQYLLKQGHFGPGGHPDMILSVNTISAPFRGTQLVYTLGERTDAAPAVRSLSIGSALSKMVHIISFISPYLPQALDLHSESRSLSFQETSFFSFLRQLWKSDWAESRDATPFDVTFEAADDRDSRLEGEPHPRTFYRSYTAYMTRNRDESDNCGFFTLQNLMAAPLLASSAAVRSFDFASIRPLPSFLEGCDHGQLATSPAVDVEHGIKSPIPLGEEYWANDGVVPIFSQWHPLPCRKTRCRHFPPSASFIASSKSSQDPGELPEAGVWHAYEVNETNHVSLIPFWRSSQGQKSFWIDVGHWLRTIDERNNTQSLQLLT